MRQCFSPFGGAPVASGMPGRGDPPQLPYYKSVYAEMNRMAGKYPFVRLSEFGKSVMGRSLLYICAGSGKRRVFYSASHHANEWITTPILLKFMDELFVKSRSGGRIGAYGAAELLKNATLCFAPLINPDGVELVLGGISEGKYYETAKKIAGAYPSIPFPSGWKANIAGTDLNLQYPAGWEKAKEIKFAQGFVGPAPRDFVGPSPLSAPESRALANFTRAISPDVILALHTQGNEIYWKYDDYNPAGSYELGRAMAEASGFSLSLTPPLSANAGYKDWFIQEYNRPGYTVEMGSGLNPLPLSQFDAIYSAVSPMFAVAAAG